MNYRDFIAQRPRGCIVVVHRGIWEAAPENSLLAVDRAITGGHKVVEIDVRRTVDGELVLLHDETFARVADLPRRPEEMTAAEVRRLRLRNRDGGSTNIMTAEHPPTLDELFELTRGRIFIHLDVKERSVIPEVVARVKAMGVAQEVDFWGNFTTPDDLAWARESIKPHDILFMPKIQLKAQNAAEQIEMAVDYGSPVCEIVYETLADIEALRELLDRRGISIWCNTLDGVACGGFTDTAALRDPDRIWGRLIGAGVSIIQTDLAGRLEDFVRD
ncbi:MAG: glycerophosphodiester phosphodiesterase family protein [Mesorhizobium sp.]|nr:MAG: glycerophosphodiester phosphodiesterase family protein [Mesorhizobium sp.]